MPVARKLGLAAAMLAIALLAIELLLQVASLAAGDRASAWRAGARVRVLCVGDSHTYGAMLPRDAAYPGQLQALLDRDAPGAFSVVNLGVPGMNTTQLRKRLPTWLSRYEPDLLLVWVGINNTWNVAEIDATEPGSRLQSFALRSRLYRGLRVWLHDRGLRRQRIAAGAAPELVERPERLGQREQRFTVAHDGVRESLDHRREPESPAVVDAAAGARAARDYRAMSTLARGAGARMVLITYPLELPPVRAVNAAMRRVADELDLPLLESADALERVPPDEVEWLGGVHPGARIYQEIARSLAPLVSS